MTARDCVRAALRGLGPPKQSSAMPLERLDELPGALPPWVPHGPMGPRALLTIGLWWLLREIELSNIQCRHVTMPKVNEVAILLPASKTDTRACGVSRTHKCVCGGLPGAHKLMPTVLCPACAAVNHLARPNDSGKTQVYHGTLRSLRCFPT